MTDVIISREKQYKPPNKHWLVAWKYLYTVEHPSLEYGGRTTIGYTLRDARSFAGKLAAKIGAKIQLAWEQPWQGCNTNLETNQSSYCVHQIVHDNLCAICGARMLDVITPEGQHIHVEREGRR